MTPWLRRTLITVVTLVVLAAVAIATALWLSQRRSERIVALPPIAPIALPTDAAAVERGGYLYRSRGCADCHGQDGAGRVFVDAPNGLRLAGSKIGPGAGSTTAAYTPVDWVRTLRHGVKPSGRPVAIMPSEDYARLTDADVGAIVAYVRTLPAAAPGGAAVLSLPLPVRVLHGLGLLPDAASKIDHTLPPAPPVAEAVSVEHGRYVAQSCTGCHGATFAGGRIPGGPPDWPPAARLAPGEGTVMARYAEPNTFVAMMRSGKRPDGSAVQVMPFEALSQMNDVDLQALHLFLRSLPAPGR